MVRFIIISTFHAPYWVLWFTWQAAKHYSHSLIPSSVGSGREAEKKSKLMGWERDGLKEKERVIMIMKKNTQSKCCKMQPLTTCWPIPSWVVAATPPTFIVPHGVIQHGMTLQTAWISCPGSASSQPLVHPQPTRWQGSRRSPKFPESVQALLRNNQTTSVGSTLFSS